MLTILSLRKVLRYPKSPITSPTASSLVAGNEPGSLHADNIAALTPSAAARRARQIDLGQAVEMLALPRLAEALAVKPLFVRPSEKGYKNASSFELGETLRLTHGRKIDLERRLDKNVRYLWAMTPPENRGELPKVHIGIQYTNYKYVEKTGKHGKLGHPTLLGPDAEQHAIFAGEILYKDGAWIINNDSGRWHSGNAALLKKFALRKQDLLAAVAHYIDLQSDLHIVRAEQHARSTPKFILQSIGMVPTRKIILA